MGLKETLLARRNRRYKSIQVDGESYWLQSLTSAEKTQTEILALDQKTGRPLYGKMAEIKARYLCLSLVDGEGGDKLFDLAEWPTLLEIDSFAFEKLYEACENFCLTEVSELEQEAVGNSE